MTLASFVLTSGEAQAQVDQSRVAEELSSLDAAERMEALGRIRTLRPEEFTPELREAIVLAVERENRARDERLRTLAQGGKVGDEHDEFYPQVLELLISVSHERNIPVLAGAAGTGMMVIRLAGQAPLPPGC